MVLERERPLADRRRGAERIVAGVQFLDERGRKASTSATSENAGPCAGRQIARKVSVLVTSRAA